MSCSSLYREPSAFFSVKCCLRSLTIVLYSIPMVFGIERGKLIDEDAAVVIDVMYFECLAEELHLDKSGE